MINREVSNLLIVGRIIACCLNKSRKENCTSLCAVTKKPSPTNVFDAMCILLDAQ
jgi:hypothetical protein